VRYTPYEGDVICSRCGASYKHKSIKMASVFLKEEKICYRMVYFILCLVSVQSSEIALES